MKFKDSAVVLFCFLSFFSVQIFAQSTPNTISGRVTNLEYPLRDVNIIVLNSEEGTFTDAYGKYSINAYPGQIIRFSSQGMKSVEIVVEDVTDYLNIKMIENTVELDEVVVKKKIGSKQERLRLEFAKNKKIYRTTFGYFNLDQYGFGAQLIDGDKLNPGAIDFATMIQGRISGARTRFNDDGTKSILIRGAVTSYDVDGVGSLVPPDYLTPQDIDRIVVLKDKAIIVVNTKFGNYVSEPGTNEPYDQAKLRNNNYNNDAITGKNQINGLPNYIQDLKKSSSIESAKLIYTKYLEQNNMNPYYYIDSYTYFVNNEDGEFASKILKDAKTVLTINPIFAKAIAYQFEAGGQLKLANKQYQSIFKMRPSYAQSYRDLAESYRDLGNIKKAASIYFRYKALIKDGLKNSDSVIQPLIAREFDNLLTLKGDALLVGKNQVSQTNNAENPKGTRLLFEWNDGEAEFELQFVNPDNKYYLWKHTIESNANRIKEEKLNGYSCKEFYIDGSLPGKWLINANYKGNKKLSPAYLKVNIYYNYGTAAQRKQVKVFRLGIKNVNQELFELVTNENTSVD